jgi:hypothetical protein
MNAKPAAPPWLRGVSRALDVQPQTKDRLQRIRPYPTDQVALQQDWARIGQDFWKVINREPRPNHP